MGLIDGTKALMGMVFQRNKDGGFLSFIDKTIDMFTRISRTIEALLKGKNIDLRAMASGTKAKFGFTKDVLSALASIGKDSAKKKASDYKAKLENLAKEEEVKQETAGNSPPSNDPSGNQEAAGTPPPVKPKSWLDSLKKKAAKKALVGIDKAEAATDFLAEKKNLLKEKTDKLREGRLGRMFGLQKERQDAVNKEVADEKKGANDRLAEKQKAKGKSGWLGKLVGALWGTSKFLVKSLWKISTWGTGTLVKALFSILPGGGTLLKATGWLARLGGGLAGRALMAGAGVLASGAAAVLASPITWVVAGVAAVAYGGWKIYKYLKRNSISDDPIGDFTRIRLAYYGYDATKESDYHKLFELEMFMKDHLKFKQGMVTITPLSTEDKEKIQDIFGVSRKDTDYKDRIKLLSDWFNRRFLPCFKGFVSAVKQSNDACYFDNLDTLHKSELPKVLDRIQIPASIFDYVKVPMFDAPDVVITKEEVETKLKTAKERHAHLKDVPKETPDKPIRQSVKGKVKSTEPPKPERSPYESYLKANQASAPGIEVENAPPDGGSATRSDTRPVGNLPKAPGELVTGDGSLTGVKLSGIGPEKIQQLDPNVRNLFLGMAKEYNTLTGKSIPVSSAARTFAEQAALYRSKPKGSAAPPGASLHEYGLALDISRVTAAELDSLGLMRKYGFTRPVGKEPWHIEPIKVGLDIERSKTDPAFRAQAVMGSVGLGGGGYGTLKDVGKPGRNNEYQKSIMGTQDTKPSSQELDTRKSKLLASVPNGASAEAKVLDKTPTPTPPPEKSPLVPAKKEGYLGTGNPFTTKINQETEPAPKPVTSLAVPTTLPEAISRAAKETGVDEALLKRFSELESSGNIKAKNPNSSASGAFQFTSGTWAEMLKKHGAKYKIPATATPNDPYYAALLTAEYIKENLKNLPSGYGQLGIDDSTAAYLAHHYGSSGASKILNAYQKDRNLPMRDVVSEDAYRSNFEVLNNKTVADYLGGLQQKVRTPTGALQRAAATMPTSIVKTSPVIAPATEVQPKREIAQRSLEIKDTPRNLAVVTSNNQASPMIQTKAIEGLLADQLGVLNNILSTLTGISRQGNGLTTKPPPAAVTVADTSSRPAEKTTNRASSSPTANDRMVQYNPSKSGIDLNRW